MLTHEDVRRWVEERRDAILELLSGMIAIDSVTGREGPLAEYCAKWLGDHGIEAILQPAKDRFNALSVVGAGTPALVISGHLDTVPPNQAAWRHGPLEPVLEDGKLYGLGASDLHASIAGAYFASLFLKDRELPGRYVTAFTIEEETTGDGTRLFLDWAEREGFLDFAQTACVVTEPTGLSEICLGNRGSSFLRIDVKGLGGHGSRPHQSRNPIEKMLAILTALRDLEQRWSETHADPAFGHATLTPTCVQAGSLERSNVIPEEAHAVVDCRLTPSLCANGFEIFHAGIAECLRAVEEEGFEVRWRELYAREGHELDEDHPLARTVMRALREDVGREAEFRTTPAGNDAVFFGKKGIPTINKVGPGHPECAHRVNEFVTVENVLAGTELFIWIGLRHFGVV